MTIADLLILGYLLVGLLNLWAESKWGGAFEPLDWGTCMLLIIAWPLEVLFLIYVWFFIRREGDD